MDAEWQSGGSRARPIPGHPPARRPAAAGPKPAERAEGPEPAEWAAARSKKRNRFLMGES
jgi:hypothetical protein